MFASVMRNDIYYTDIHNMRFEDLLFFQKHGFPKDFENHKNTKYFYMFPLEKNGKFSANFTLGSANKIEDIFLYAEYVKKNEIDGLKFGEENNCECYPKYATTAYKRGFRLGSTVWVFENPDFNRGAK